MAHDDVHDDSVLIRTIGGQRATLDEVDLDAVERRLLRLFNGYTSLGVLARRLDPKQDWESVAVDLLRRGLVKPDGTSSR